MSQFGQVVIRIFCERICSIFIISYAMSIVIFAITVPAFCYTPSIGIPSPVWGDLDPIEKESPAWPEGWPSTEIQGYYYFDNTAQNCSNDLEYGYPDKPRCDLPGVATFSAGDYIEVHGGPYNYTVGAKRYEWTFRGTEEDPIWFRGKTESERPEIQGFIRVYGSYAIMENIIFTPRPSDQYTRVSFGNGTGGIADHMILRHSEVAGNGIKTAGFSSCVSITGMDATSKTHDIVLYDLTIHDVGDDDAQEENDYHGVLPGGYTYNIWILDCSIFNLGGDSVQVGSNNYVGEQMPHHIYIGGCDFYSNYENAVDVKNANHTIISGNKLHDFVPHVGYDYANPITLHQQGGDTPSYVWILFNEFYNCSQAIRVQDFKNVHIIGNTFWNIRSTSVGSKTSCWYNTFAVSMRTGLTSGSIVDNTFYDVDVFLTFPGNLSDDRVKITGNIFSKKSDPDTYDICIDSTSSDFIDMSSNLFDSLESVRFGNIYYQDIDTFVSSGLCQNCQSGYPLFVSPPVDFSLQGESPARNSSMGDPIYDTFFSIYGSSIKRDHVGVRRPQGIAWDKGAFEFSENIPVIQGDVQVTP